MAKNFQFKSAARPSLFAYPEPLQPPKKEESTKVATAVLSTASKAKALKEKKEKEDKSKEKDKKEDVDMDDKASVANSVAAPSTHGGGASVAATPGTTVVGSIATDSVAASDIGVDQMLVDETSAAPKDGATPKADEEKKEEETKEDGEGEKKKEEPEPTEEILNNPCRVLKGQAQHISFPKDIDGASVRYRPLLENRRVGFLLLNDQRPEEPEDLFLEDDKAKDDDEQEPEPPEPFEWADN